MVRGSLHMQNESFKVVGVSAVLVANQHNPTIMNPDFLRSKEIAKPEWEAIEAFSSSVFTRIGYSNGVFFTVDQNRCIIEQRVDGEFKSSYEAHNCAKKYAEVLEHTPYTAFGLNSNLLMPNEQPSDWLKSRFLRSEEWPGDIEPTNLVFRHVQDSVTYQFSLNIGQSAEKEDSITIQCNFHFNIQNSSNKVKEISNTVQNLEKYQGFLLSMLDRYFMGRTS